MNLRRLSDVIGVEVEGMDLRSPPSATERDAITAAFARHHLLLFRNQELTHEQQTRFAEYFGPIVGTHRTDAQGQMFISNTVEGGVLGDGEVYFHSDHSYFENPDTSAIVLYAIAVASSGGETHFANTLKAFEDLNPLLLERIRGLHALHISMFVSGEQRRTLKDLDPRLHGYQPLTWQLPDTGQCLLYVSRYAVKIVELEKTESDSLLAELWQHLYRDHLLYKHTWRVGDLIVWNNRILQHARTDFDPKESRTLRKSTVGVAEKVTEVPYAAV